MQLRNTHAAIGARNPPINKFRELIQQLYMEIRYRLCLCRDDNSRTTKSHNNERYSDIFRNTYNPLLPYFDAPPATILAITTISGRPANFEPRISGTAILFTLLPSQAELPIHLWIRHFHLLYRSGYLLPEPPGLLSNETPFPPLLPPPYSPGPTPSNTQTVSRTLTDVLRNADIH